MFLPLIIAIVLIIILAVLGIAGMFFAKNKNLQKLSLILVVILCLIVSLLEFTALPSNYIIGKVLSIIIGIIPLLSVVLLYNKKINLFIYKIIATVSIIAGILYFIVQ